MPAREARPDAQLRRTVERAQRGERAALEALYAEHFDRIYGYLQITVGNRSDAEDLTTQVFLKMIESIGRFRWRSVPFSAWLFRIAHNVAMDHFRRNRRISFEAEVEPEGLPERSAEEAALAAVGHEAALAALACLTREQQQVLTLKFVLQFRNADVAKILGRTEGAVKSLQHRALDTLLDRALIPA